MFNIFYTITNFHLSTKWKVYSLETLKYSLEYKIFKYFQPSCDVNNESHLIFPLPLFCLKP